MRSFKTPLAALLLAVSPSLCLASGIPSSNELDFTVLRDGDEVGSHVIRFEEKDQELDVNIATDVAVKLPFVGVTVYRFTHRGHEVWSGGALQELDSTTDDDGTAHSLEVNREAEQLAVKSDVTDALVEGGIVPASLWNNALVTSQQLLNTLDGTQMKVTVTDLGEEEITREGARIAAHHYKIEGDLNREVWYDAEGVLAQVRFAAKDDSEIKYVLK